MRFSHYDNYINKIGDVIDFPVYIRDSKARHAPRGGGLISFLLLDHLPPSELQPISIRYSSLHIRCILRSYLFIRYYMLDGELLLLLQNLLHVKILTCLGMLDLH